MALPVGSIAPDFELKTATIEGRTSVKLSDHRGKDNVLLLFFPGAFTGVCKEELCTVSDGLIAYQSNHAVVYGVSVDSPFAQSAFAKQEEIKVPLLSDYGKTVTAAYDVVLEDFAGLGASSAKRAAFVIDREGVIRYSEVTPTPKDLPNFAAIQEALGALG